MPLATFESTVKASSEELFAWHTRPGAFKRLCPPWQEIEILSPAPVENGSQVRLRMKKGPFWVGWTAEHREVDPGEGFVDVQVAGPFAHWVHRHEFESIREGAVLCDRIDYELPGGALGRAVAGRRIERDLATTFAYRHETTSRDLLRHRTFAGHPRLRVAVSGSSGLVGDSLVPFLTTGGHQAVRLVRAPPEQPDTASWKPETGLLAPETVGPLDAVVHLAGESIAGERWTAARKRRIRSSRIDGTRNLIRSLGRMPVPPKTMICASAVGYYGSRGDQLLDERSAGGEGFLADLCREWEAAAGEAAELGMRVVVLRFGVILSPAGGALAKMLPPFKLGAGGRLGSGRQYVSWVSIDDALAAIYHAIVDDRLSGPLNVVAPNPVTNGELTEVLARVLGRPAFLPVPERAGQVVFGEMADEVLLASARVRPRKLEEAGFEFGDAALERTLARLLGRLEMS